MAVRGPGGLSGGGVGLFLGGAVPDAMIYGYARVSTVDQDPTSQTRALRLAGVRRVLIEHRSGAGPRPVLEHLLTKLRPGDTLVAYKVDRLARSLADLLRVLQLVGTAGASFRSLTEPIETATPAGRMLVQLLGAFAEFERAIIKERCTAGRLAAIERGVRFGRPVRFNEADRQTLADRVQRGESCAAVARSVGAHPDTVRRAIGLRRKGRASC